MLDGVTVSESSTQKDELILEGNDVQNVSQSGKFTTLSRSMLLLMHFSCSCVHPGRLPGTEQGYP